MKTVALSAAWLLNETWTVRGSVGAIVDGSLKQEMVAEIKKDPAYKFLPIVMLTTESKDDLKAKGKALGVKAWLVKPFNKAKFLIALEKLLG